MGKEVKQMNFKKSFKTFSALLVLGLCLGAKTVNAQGPYCTSVNNACLGTVLSLGNTYKIVNIWNKDRNNSIYDLVVTPGSKSRVAGLVNRQVLFWGNFGGRPWFNVVGAERYIPCSNNSNMACAGNFFDNGTIARISDIRDSYRSGFIGGPFPWIVINRVSFGLPLNQNWPIKFWGSVTLSGGQPIFTGNGFCIYWPSQICRYF